MVNGVFIIVLVCEKKPVLLEILHRSIYLVVGVVFSPLKVRYFILHMNT